MTISELRLAGYSGPETLTEGERAIMGQVLKALAEVRQPVVGTYRWDAPAKKLRPANV